MYQYILPKKLTARLEGTSYQPDADDYQLLNEAIANLQSNVSTRAELLTSYGDLILEEMQRILSLKEGAGVLHDSLNVIVSTEEEE
mgnify:CR=1 FL=1